MESLEEFLRSRDIHKAVYDAVDYAYCIGLIIRSPTNSSDSKLIGHLPFSLTPSPIPRHMFCQMLSLQNDINRLMFEVVSDTEFIRESYKSLFEVDEFTRRIFEIHLRSSSQTKNKLQMALIRSDYMIDETASKHGRLKQIEINMIASGLGGNVDMIRSIHQNVLEKKNLLKEFELPTNSALRDLAKSLIHAWNEYGNDKALIMFLVIPDEINIFDQRHLENEVYSLSKINVVRATFLDVFNKAKVDANNNLLFSNDEEVAVVYYRAGYDPKHYPTKKEWSARQLLDSSNAINCPSAGYQLVGAKKMQQVLAQDGAVERFIKDKESVERIRNTFAGLYTLDMTLEGDEHVKMAMNNPEKYVLKPQLEGGGNNLYGDDIVLMLTDIGSDSRRCSYILMNRIKPMPFQTALVINTACHLVEGVSELGVFGYILSKGSELLANKQCGHLLRTKASHHNDGGVASGVAVLDTPALTNSNTTRECC